MGAPAERRVFRDVRRERGCGEWISKRSYCPITPNRTPFNFRSSNQPTFCPNQVLLPDNLYFFAAAENSVVASKYATGLSPYFASQSDSHRAFAGAAKISGSPGTYAIFPKSFSVSISGSDHP